MKVLWKNRKYMQIQVCGLVPVFYWVERISGYLVIASQCQALYKQQHRGMRRQLCQRLLLVIGDIKLVFILSKHKFCSEKEYVELQRQFSVCLPYPVFLLSSLLCPRLLSSLLLFSAPSKTSQCYFLWFPWVPLVELLKVQVRHSAWVWFLC